MTAFHAYIKGHWPIWAWPQTLPFHLWRDGHPVGLWQDNHRFPALPTTLPALLGYGSSRH